MKWGFISSDTNFRSLDRNTWEKKKNEKEERSSQPTEPSCRHAVEQYDFGGSMKHNYKLVMSLVDEAQSALQTPITVTPIWKW